MKGALNKPKFLRIGHSPDPDDAFMFYALAQGRVRISDYAIQHVLEDIQSLNARALRAELEVTAISAHAYAYLADRYWILRSGASMGRGYGPIVVARSPLEAGELPGKRVAIPGRLTTAYLLLRLYASGFMPIEMPFDAILRAVAEGEAEAGLLIHEGQLTYREWGLVKVLDLGQRWAAESAGLPLPLGLDVVRADLGETLAAEISRALRVSIEYARAHEEEALDYALLFGRGLDREMARQFVRMYANQDTLDLGEEGERALQLLYSRAARQRIIPELPRVKIV